MSMYLVSDEELNTIIRLRRQDVIQFVGDLQEQNPGVSFDEILRAAGEFFARQAVTYDYLEDYASEEIAYGLTEPESVFEETTEPEVAEEDLRPVEIVDDEIQVDDYDVEPAAAEPEPGLEDADVVTYEPEPENVDPLTDASVPDESIIVVDDTVQVVEDDQPVVSVEAPDIDAVDGDGVAESVPAVEDVPLASAELEPIEAERGPRISLRALQRELRQIDKG